MTAEEFLINNANDISYEEGVMFAADVTPQMLKEFVKIKCKEQRRICYENAEIDTYDWDRHRIDKDSILNAPEPEI